MQKTILEAVALVVLVIFFFLRNLRATLIPVITIPVSLIGALIFMQIFGFSINTLTLLAMVLAIGLVVDDAIVVLENIYRHIEEGLPPKEAALKGVKEIGFAVLAMTFTLAAVFARLPYRRAYRPIVCRVCVNLSCRRDCIGVLCVDFIPDDECEFVASTSGAR